MRVQRRDPSLQNSAGPPGKVFVREDQVGGKRPLAHFNSLCRLLKDGQRTKTKITRLKNVVGI